MIHGLHPADIVQPPKWEQLKRTLRREVERSEPSPYWVLQLLRVWASLETRDVVRSKLDSAEWALERLPRQYHAIIQAAIHFYQRSSKSDDQSLIAEDFPMFVAEIRQWIDGTDR